MLVGGSRFERERIERGVGDTLFSGGGGMWALGFGCREVTP